MHITTMADTKLAKQYQKKSDREQVLDEINEFTVKLVGVIVFQKEIKLEICTKL